MQNEYGSDVQVILVEVQGASDKKMKAFALKHGWLNNDVIWTTERVTSTGMNGIPNYVLLDANGIVVSKGYSNRDHQKIEKSIEEMLKLKGKSPKGTPKQIASINKTLAKGNLGAAMLESIQAIENPKGKDLLTEAAIANAKNAGDQLVKQMNWCMENGYAMHALELAKQLEKAFKGAPRKVKDKPANIQTLYDDFIDLAQTMTAHVNVFKVNSWMLELKADKDLSKIEAKILDDGADEKHIKKLDRLAEKYQGLNVAKRIAGLRELAQG